MSINPDDYEGQSVLILGRGEANIIVVCPKFSCTVFLHVYRTLLEKYPTFAASSNVY